MGDSCGAGVVVAWQRLQQLQGASSHADAASHKVNVHLVPLRGKKLRKKSRSVKRRTQPIMLEVRCRRRQVFLLVRFVV